MSENVFNDVTPNRFCPPPPHTHTHTFYDSFVIQLNIIKHSISPFYRFYCFDFISLNKHRKQTWQTCRVTGNKEHRYDGPLHLQQGLLWSPGSSIFGRPPVDLAWGCLSLWRAKSALIKFFCLRRSHLLKYFSIFVNKADDDHRGIFNTAFVDFSVCACVWSPS